MKCFSTTARRPRVDWDPSKCLEAHLPDIALFCLRAAKDRHRAAELADRVVAHARGNLSSSAHSASFSAWLYSILREECALAARMAFTGSRVRITDVPGDGDCGEADGSVSAASSTL